MWLFVIKSIAVIKIKYRFVGIGFQTKCFILHQIYDTIHIMKRYMLAILLLGLTGCVSGVPETELGQDTVVTCNGNCSGVGFSMPNGNDLKLETAHHVVHVTANPDTPYAYYVWTGDKSYSDDPDIVGENGDAYVLTSE